MPTLQARPPCRKPPPLAVRLPDIPSVPELYRNTRYVLGWNNWLLSAGDTNPKLAKSERGGRYRTWGLTLAPAKSSGRQLCASASAGCRKVCLHYQGHGGIFPGVPAGRIAKSIAWVDHREWFEARLRWELDRIDRMAETATWEPVVRLNVMSDVMWERELPWVFDDHPGITMYDYSKHYQRMLRFCVGDFPPNYHLTFSRSETNHVECLEVLRRGGSVAAVFRDKTLPRTWCGFPVVGGDDTDLRFLDPSGSWVGLYAKGTAKNDTTGFVVDAARTPLN